MNILQAMKDALESLMWIGTGNGKGTIPASKAITNLRAAIAEMEKAEPVAYTAEGECWSRGFISKVDMEFRLKALNIPLEKLIYLYLHPAPIPEGWQLVPKEPTKEMYEAASHLVTGTSGNKFEYPDELYEAYSAMLAAAPKPEEMK